MKLISLILTYIICLNAFAVNDVTIRNQQDVSTKLKITNTQTSNMSATEVAPQTYLLGDQENFLVNESFEHTTYSTGWTNSDGTLSLEQGAAHIKQGVKAAKLVTAADNVEFYQDSTLYASGMIGAAGTISAWIKNTSPNVYFCQRIAGAWVKNTDGLRIKNCKLVNQTGVYTEYSMPVTFGATSNGAGFISLDPTTAAATTTTGTTYFDKIKVAAGQSFIPMPSTTQTTAYASGSTGSGVIFTGTASTVGTGNYTFSAGTFTASRDITVTFSCYSVNGSSVTTSPTIYVGGVLKTRSHSPAAASNNVTTSWTGTVTSGTTFHCQNDANTAGSGAVYVTSRNYNPESSVAQSSDFFSTDNDPLTYAGSGSYTLATLPTAPIGTFITWIYTGSTTATKTQTTSPPTQTVASMKADGILLTPRAYSGTGTFGLPPTIAINVGKGFSGYTIAGYTSAAKSGPLTTDTTLTALATMYGFFVKTYNPVTGILVLDAGTLPNSAITTHGFMDESGNFQTAGYWTIETQKKKDFMVGDISGLEKCATTLECTDDFVARVAAGNVISGTNYPNWLTGCTGGAAAKTCTFAAGIFPTSIPSCQVSALNASYRFADKTESLASVSVSVYRADTVALVDEGFTLTCSRTGADYIGKTAKAVASDQNDRTPSDLNVKTCGFMNAGAAVGTNCTGSPCTEYRDNCGVVSPCTRSGTGTYSCVYANGTFAANAFLECGSGISTSLQGSNTAQADANGGYTYTIRGFSNTLAAAADITFSGWCKGKAP